MEYIDLYLIHWPMTVKPGKYEFPFPKDEIEPFDMKSVWEAMEECLRLGLTKAIGVSNFSSKKLHALLSTAQIPPSVNQVEVNPLWQQRKLRELCVAKGIQICAWSPLGARGALWGSDGVMECAVLMEIAEAKGKTLAQICLRWVYEQGDVVLVKSFNEKRMMENLDILGWELSDEDNHKISQIPQCKGYQGLDFVSPSGLTNPSWSFGMVRFDSIIVERERLQRTVGLIEPIVDSAVIPSGIVISSIYLKYKKMGRIPEVLLISAAPDSKPMPMIGFGTATYPFGPSEAARSAVVRAVAAGYRHFDTAAVYGSETSLGEAVADAVESGLVGSRDELFITSKLWCSDAHSDRVIPALRKTLQNLQMEYIDLYLIHWPIIRNFALDREIPPAVNQVEVNPLWQQKKLREFCVEKGIKICAYSPLGAKGTVWGNDRVMECEVLKEIAQAKGKTLAQICLRWVHEQGDCVLVKSYNDQRMKENLEIFDWELSEEDKYKINQIPQQRSVPAEDFISDVGPFKSLMELWDGEI
uniref:NADP-dependent oxidoreductase domain-containing protein n=1 Tax=Ananas comosus var. bracteatus TaxID=296719 RepID=A0A6V7Q2W4_ANACO|nr:unnamed protein product [Ananas comosus var. bracteatus]